MFYTLLHKAGFFGRATGRRVWVLDGDRRCVDHRAYIGRAACSPTTSATLGSWMRRIILTSRTLLRAPSSSALHRSSPACGGRCSARSARQWSVLRRCARAASRDRHGRGGEGVGRESGASSHDAAGRELPTFPSSAAAGAAPSRSPVLASGCHGRTSRGVGDLRVKERPAACAV